MKRILLSLLLAISQIAAFADGSALLVTLRDGTTAGYVLSEKPTLTFGEKTMLVKTSDASTEYLREAIANITFVDAETLDITTLPTGSTTFEYRDNTIRLSGAPLQVYTLDGVMVKQGKGSVSLSDLPSGIYVVKMNHQAIKVTKK